MLSSDVAQEVVVPVSGVLEAMRASQLHSTMLGHPVPLETSPALVVGLARNTGVALTKLDVTAPELASRINLTIQDAKHIKKQETNFSFNVSNFKPSNKQIIDRKQASNYDLIKLLCCI